MIDDLIFRMVSEKPYPPVLERLNVLFGYDPIETREKGDAWVAEHPMGTGTYKFVKWDRGSQLVMTANPNYWMDGKPKIENIVVRILPEMSTRVAELIHGPYFARIAIEMKACRIINIKQGHVAGLARSKEVHDICRQAGVGVWCSGMFETGIGRAVQVALAGLPNFTYPNDISASARYYPHDIVDPEFALNTDGTISVPDGPGLGVEVNRDVLDSYTVAREVIRA